MKRISPLYYDSFQCKGGACRHSCCIGWPITINRDAYFRLIGMECSEELHHKIECAMHLAPHPSPEYYAQITPNWLGDCPLHRSDGLCQLQLECGEVALPEICRVYPRSKRDRVDGQDEHYKCICTASCEAIVEVFMNQTAPLSFCEQDVPEEIMAIREVLPAGATEKIQQAIKTMQDRTCTLPERLSKLGAVSLKSPKECTLAQMSALLGELHESSQSLKRFAGEALAKSLQDMKTLNTWATDSAAFENCYPDWEIWFEHLLCNHIVYDDYPYGEPRLMESESFDGLAALYGLLRVVCTGTIACGKTDREALVDAIAGTFRYVEHTSFSVQVVRGMKRYGVCAGHWLAL